MSTPDMTKTGRLVPGNAVPGVSPAQSAHRQQFVGLRHRFKGLDAPTQSTWQRGADVINQREGRTGRKKLTQANTYVMLNSAALAVGLDVTDVCPANLNLPAPYPAIRLVASNINGNFSVALDSPGYGDSLLLLSAPPEPAGRVQWANSSFKPTTTLGELQSGLTPIGAAIAALWGEQAVGMEIAVRLIAVSSAGVRRGEYTMTGIVGATALVSAHPVPELEVTDAAA